MQKTSNIIHKSAEKISQRVFYILIGVAVAVFGAFFLIGYDMPFDDNPDFNAPLFTDALILIMWLMLGIAIVLAVWAAVKEYRTDKADSAVVNGIPCGKIRRFVWAGTLLLLILSFALGASAPLLVNGANYEDWLWLKVSDMFVCSSLALLAVAIVAVVFGATRYIRKESKNV